MQSFNTFYFPTASPPHFKFSQLKADFKYRLTNLITSFMIFFFFSASAVGNLESNKKTNINIPGWYLYNSMLLLIISFHDYIALWRLVYLEKMENFYRFPKVIHFREKRHQTHFSWLVFEKETKEVWNQVDVFYSASTTLALMNWETELDGDTSEDRTKHITSLMTLCLACKSVNKTSFKKAATRN